MKGEDFVQSHILEVFEFESRTQVIEFTTDRFVFVDEGTGRPSIGTVTVKYMPAAGLAVDSVTLKDYFESFADLSFRQERLTSRIREDLQKVISCNLIVETGFPVEGSSLEAVCFEGGMDSPKETPQ